MASSGKDERSNSSIDSESTMTSSEMEHHEDSRLVEEVYQERRRELLLEIEAVRKRKHPMFLQRLAVLKKQFIDQLEQNVYARNHELECNERDYRREVVAAEQEFAQGKLQLEQDLLAQRQAIRQEIDNMKLDSREVNLRQLRYRSRPPETCASLCKISSLRIELSQGEIAADLAEITGGSNVTKAPHAAGACQSAGSTLPLYHVVNGKLWHKQSCFAYGTPVYVQGIAMVPYPGVISGVFLQGVTIKSLNRQIEELIFLEHLNKGVISLTLRAN
ncbi:uncharacterized protein LOC128721661 [Anopheles nili]|uniref:uncharacterized protein LOC128721661 n=1 Tax=Anopheles nili TaxID=185578 RepID=UPI00237BD65B|nr:uncharacterized protein LOC128721661 [Anopheles nili]